MTKLCTTAVLLALLYASGALASEPAASSVARPYYQCVKSSAVRYAKKAEDVGDVIQAARASCEEKRIDLLATFIAEHAMRGTPGNLEQLGNRTMERIEATWRPDLVKAILDAR